MTTVYEALTGNLWPIKKFELNKEYYCEAIKITEDKVLAKINDVWIELKPGKDM
jgi:hypothetical protein